MHERRQCKKKMETGVICNLNDLSLVTKMCFVLLFKKLFVDQIFDVGKRTYFYCLSRNTTWLQY